MPNPDIGGTAIGFSSTVKVLEGSNKRVSIAGTHAHGGDFFIGGSSAQAESGVLGGAGTYIFDLYGDFEIWYRNSSTLIQGGVKWIVTELPPSPPKPLSYTVDY